MPAIFAHYAFGAQTLPGFSVNVRRIVQSHRVLFDLGLQGPDFYFFDQLIKLRGKHYSHIGTKLHNDACANLLLVLEGNSGRRPDSETLAYLFGLIGHFALDSAAHPHIDLWVQELAYDHNRLETEFDRFLLEKDGINARSFALGNLVAASKRERMHVGKIYEAAGFGSAKDIAALLNDFKIIGNHINIKNDRAYVLLQKIIYSVGAAAISGIFMGTTDKLSEITNPRLFVLFLEAQSNYIKLTENYYQHVFGNATLDDYFSRNFDT